MVGLSFFPCFWAIKETLYYIVFCNIIVCCLVKLKHYYYAYNIKSGYVLMVKNNEKDAPLNNAKDTKRNQILSKYTIMI
jgi:hypothetical protein